MAADLRAARPEAPAGELVATLAVAILIGGILIPRFENPPAYQASYVDVLTAADSANDTVALPTGETE